MVEWSPGQLSEACGVDLRTISEFEARFRRPTADAQRRIRYALERAGVEIVAENGDGAGVRLKLNVPELRAIAR